MGDKDENGGEPKPKPNFEDGRWDVKAGGEREGPDAKTPQHEKGWGNRKIEPKDPNAPKKGPETELSVGPFYTKKSNIEKSYWFDTKEGEDDKTFHRGLNVKVNDVEALSASVKLNEGKAKAVLIKAWESEEAASESDATSGLHLRLIDAERETLLAYILIRAQRQQPGEVVKLDALLGKTVSTMQHSGRTLEGEMQPLPDEEDPRAIGVEGWLGGFVGAGHLAEAEVFVRVGFIERATVVFTLVLYSPKLTDDTLVALRAQRVFEIARSKLQLSS